MSTAPGEVSYTMVKASEILSEAFHEDDSMDEKLPHRIYDEKGEEVECLHVECVQKDTIQRIFGLWKDLIKQIKRDKEEAERQRQEDQRALERRDQALMDSYNESTKAIEKLRQDLENRKLINNFNEKDKDNLRQLLKDQNDKTDGVDAEVDSYTKRLNSVEGKIVILVWVVPILFTIILAIQAIVLYTLMNHLAAT